MNEEQTQELDRIYQRDGVLIPAVVVDEARPEDAPLHPSFTWDDGIAAEEWRRQEARRIIRLHRIVIEPSGVTEIVVNPQHDETVDGTTVPAWMNITHPNTDLRGYYRTADLLADQRTKEMILEQVRREIRSLRRKYQGLVDFDAIVRAELEQTHPTAA